MACVSAWGPRGSACRVLALCAILGCTACDQATQHEATGPAPVLPALATVSGEPPAAGATGTAPSDEPRRVFTSPLAGRWYPADPRQLCGEMDDLLARVSTPRLPDVCAVVLPHAGYQWSGPTAAYAIHQLQGRSFRRVVVIGPSHRLVMENVASVPGVTHYATPLGEVALDRDFIARLRAHVEFQTNPAAHEHEHSVQIELPWLQHVLGDFSLVPIVVGRLDRPTMRRIAGILGGLVDSGTLVVASSDFTHYGADFGYVPFQDQVPARLRQLDEGTLERVCRQDFDGLFDYIEQTGTTVCGRCAIGILLAMLPADAEVHRLHYDTSGSLTGDYSHSVSYAALAITVHWQRGEPVAAKPVSPLTETDRVQLLHLARRALTSAVKNGEVPTLEQLGIEASPAMQRVAAAFVTLHKAGRLRGCIGEIFPTRPLCQCVLVQAVQAGLRDHRFPPVEASELADIDFEISVLTAPRPVASAADIVLGRHGIILRKGGQMALFLPQVASEQGWDRETTLTCLARKAGLPADGWRDGASLEVFEAIVFGEQNRRPGPAKP